MNLAMAGRWMAAFAVLLCAGGSADATTFLPVTFNDLVTRADVIFVGEVIDVRPFPLQTRDGTIIKTRVIFRVSDPIFGTTAALAGTAGNANAYLVVQSDGNIVVYNANGQAVWDRVSAN